VKSSWAYRSFPNEYRLAADTDLADLATGHTNGDMDFARPSHLHTLAADDVRCPGVWMDCAVLDQVSTQRATRSPSRRIFRNAESWREHSTEYCRVVLFPRL